jgi:hypothetical protein
MKNYGSVLALLAALVVVAAGPAAAAPQAHAQHHAKTPAATISTTVNGTATNGAAVAGRLTRLHFVNAHGQAALRGVFNGTVTPVGGTAQQITNQVVTLPLVGAAPAAGCQILDLVLGPLNLNLLGLVVHLDTVHLNITAVPGPGNLLGNLLCGIANLLNGGNNVGALVGELNKLLGLTHGFAIPGALHGAATLATAVNGTAANGTAVTGQLTNVRFVKNRQGLALRGVLNGTATPVGGTAKQITNQLVTIPVIGAAPNANCQILDLVLGPLNLNLLGLVVHLDTVHLNITAVPGPGNLLGNLLCGLANALNGNAPLGALAKQLNRLLGLTGHAAPITHALEGAAALSTAVTGTATNGAAVSGQLTKVHFVDKHGAVALDAVFNGTVTPVGGTAQQITNQHVTIPVIGAAPGAGCQILDLVLGPLNLNLLGLVVHLDTVHLNITAVPGPGNLLGNLLCGIASLLNGNGPLGGLAPQLNKLLGLH